MSAIVVDRGGAEGAPLLAEESEVSRLQQLCTTVAGAAALFYWAEKDENPGIQTYWDALLYVATSLSVGYANVFPVTQAGKVIAAMVMTAGPAMAARALDPPGAVSEPRGGEIVEKLDAILMELRRLNAR